ncbi:MAG: hypothetical protein WDO24_30340 [Pseudomonadota bacterium]
MCFEGARNLGYERTRHADQLSPELRDGVFAEGMACTLADYVAALEQGDRFARPSGRAVAGAVRHAVDSQRARRSAGGPRLDRGDSQCNSIWTLAGSPCVTLPAGVGRTGLPLGVQLIGARFADERLLDMGKLGPDASRLTRRLAQRSRWPDPGNMR